jgi:hypothetical protein
MTFPKSAQIKGGLRKATESQKLAARQWMLKNQPWLKSTGPSTILGKFSSSLNAFKPEYSYLIESWKCDFQAECVIAEAMISRYEEAFANQELSFLSSQIIEQKDGDRVSRRYVIHARC